MKPDKAKNVFLISIFGLLFLMPCAIYAQVPLPQEPQATIYSESAMSPSDFQTATQNAETKVEDLNAEEQSRTAGTMITEAAAVSDSAMAVTPGATTEGTAAAAPPATLDSTATAAPEAVTDIPKATTTATASGSAKTTTAVTALSTTAGGSILPPPILPSPEPPAFPSWAEWNLKITPLDEDDSVTWPSSWHYGDMPSAPVSPWLKDWRTIDSDGDGVPDYLDPAPLDPSIYDPWPPEEPPII